ncbi:MAG: hypothetical protein ACLQIQ_13745 [Beijerinckiaceae bacterium]
MDSDGFLKRRRKSQYDFLEEIEAVTGHLRVRKYDPIPTEMRTVILRPPVQREISQYFFRFSPAVTPESELKTCVKSAGLDITDFARLPTIRWYCLLPIFRDTPA